MTDLRRIRIDNFGLITQSAKGKMVRIDLSRPEIDRLKRDVPTGLKELQTLRPEIEECFDSSGRLNARVDVADEPVDCLTRPLRIYYNIEPMCNLKCSFCGPRDLHGCSIKASEETEVFLLDEIAIAGTFQVQLTGGEVFLRGRHLFKTLNRTRELGLATLLGTNGVWRHIHDRKAFVREMAQFRHIIEIKISIDGNRQFHDSVRGPGTYDEAVKTLFDLSEVGFTTRINTTIFRESCTIEQIEHLAGLAKQANAGLQAIPERSCGRAEGKTAYDLPSPQALQVYTIRAKELREQFGIAVSFNFDIFGGSRQLPIYDPGRPFSCGAGLWGFAVTHLGEVYPCGFSIEIGKPPRFLVGVISQETSLLDLWLHSPVLSEWRNAGKDSKCQQCEYYKRTCWGGCMVQAYVAMEKLNALDPYCLKEK
ncbi:MAG: SPASM domain-containing protein [Nitrospirae bacterium]|nr:SPASM domain-containing protein [Nitrospirota bacterium]